MDEASDALTWCCDWLMAEQSVPPWCQDQWMAAGRHSRVACPHRACEFGVVGDEVAHGWGEVVHGRSLGLMCVWEREGLVMESKGGVVMGRRGGADGIRIRKRKK